MLSFGAFYCLVLCGYAFALLVPGMVVGVSCLVVFGVDCRALIVI